MTHRSSRMPGSRMVAVTAAAVLMPLTLSAPAFAGSPHPSGGTGARTGAAAPDGQAAPAVPTGVVTQTNVPTVTPGPFPGVARFTVHLPEGTTGQVSALMAFEPYQLPPAGYTSWRVASHLHATCAVNGGPYQTCDWVGGIDDGDDPLAAYLRLPMPAADATATMTYDVRISTDYGALPEDQLLHGWLQVESADGTPVAVGGAQIQYLRGETPATRRGVLYARDSTGMLWRYEGTDTSQSTVPFKAPVKVGGGWNAYTAIVPLGAQSAGATGDVVARDGDGVLWYFAHTGDPAHPFASRVRVGAGWNIYTALSATSDSGARHADLVARDRDGVLWRYRATGAPNAPFAPRERIGAGWNAYTAITPYGDGVVARDAAGVLWSYPARLIDNGADPFEPRIKVGAGWNTYTAMSGSNVANGPAADSLMARDSAGRLWWYDQKSDHIPGARTIVGAGWNIYTAIF